VVRRVRELGAECVMGNHDEKHVRWAKHEAKSVEDPSYKNPMRPLPPERRAQHDALGADNVAWLAALPMSVSLRDGWVGVHGGVQPNRALADQKAATLLRCRWVDSSGKMISKSDPSPGSVHWSTMWRGPEVVVYGHHVHDLAAIHRTEFAIGIDTGCCFGGRLTAIDVATSEIIQVTARRAYAPLREANEEDA
jgi:hypothetical protein